MEFEETQLNFMDLDVIFFTSIELEWNSIEILSFHTFKLVFFLWFSLFYTDIKDIKNKKSIITVLWKLI